MYLDEDVARKLINLNPEGLIDPEIAERQFKVIVSGFNHLCQPENNYLYIADEVGLGKTYIALGIISLIRHFSDNYMSHTNLILVPKQNLQVKWQNEINSFIRLNYLLPDGRVKSALKTSVGLCGDDQVHNRLTVFDNNFPAYQIFRNSSLSRALNYFNSFSYKEHFDEDILETVVEDYSKQFENVVYRGYDLKSLFLKAVSLFGEEYDKLYKCYAFLLNMACPFVDALVVDEAHNFKGGVEGNTTIRNNMVSRFFGRVQDGDSELLEALGIEKGVIQPKAKKVVFLSATPIDLDMVELKNQFDCFLPQHNFPDQQRDEDIESVSFLLNSNLIRGLMTLKIGDEKISRNMYRKEHRKGNVDKSVDDFQRIDTDLDSLVLGLIQYKTIKQLKKKNNASFELGMLAGFETFSASSSVNGKEYDEHPGRHEKEAEDLNVIQDIVKSYRDEFKEEIPHIKQDRLVDQVLKLIMTGEKALIFVRRIASVDELEKRIADKYSENIAARLKSGDLSRQDTVIHLLAQFNERKNDEAIDRVLSLVTERIVSYHKQILNHIPGFDVSENNTEPGVNEQEHKTIKIQNRLKDIYDSIETNPQVREYQELVRTHIKRSKRLDKEFIESALEIVQSDKYDTDEINDTKDAILSRSYFFQDFFIRKPEGRRFRKRAYTRDWYEPNYYLIFRTFNNTTKHNRTVNYSSLTTANKYPEKANKTERGKFEFCQEQVKIALKSLECSGSDENVHECYKKETFLTSFIINKCYEEFYRWFDKVLESNSNSLDAIIDEIDLLFAILKGVFRNGSGLLSVYIIESVYGKSNFNNRLITFLDNKFPEVIQEVKTIIRDYSTIVSKNFAQRHSARNLLQDQQPVLGVSGQHNRNISRVAAQFRMPGWPYILITTDILKEGEDLHLYCKHIYHYGVSWRPSGMEQRTGRIDRIGSLAYKQLTKDEKICESNMLHVFFPYLADTLEVNQVRSLFSDMNNFIDTFYDFTQTTIHSSTVKTDDLVIDIPKQYKARLTSKYDIDSFQCIAPNGSSLKTKETIGLNEEEFCDRLEKLCTKISEEYNERFYYPPSLDKNNFVITGDAILEQERSGPFRIAAINSSIPGKYEVEMQSLICKKGDIKNGNSNMIEEKLMESDLQYIQYRDGICAAKQLDINTKLETIVSDLAHVLKTADNIEADFTDDGDITGVNFSEIIDTNE